MIYVTGLHRQILYGRRADFPDEGIPLFLSVVYGMAVAVLSLMAGPSLAGAKPLLMDFRSYHILLLSAVIAGLPVIFAPNLKKFRSLLGFIIVFLAGYLQGEVIFRAFPPVAPQFISSIIGPTPSVHLQNFFLHRMYHIFPLTALFAYFLAFPTRSRLNLIKFGRWDTLTGTLNPNKPRSWKSIVGSFGLLILSVLAVMILRKGGGVGINAMMMAPVMLYVLWNCLVEEMIFRGILLGVTAKPMGVETAVTVQGVMFAASHFDPSQPLFSLMAVLIFAFLGWLFGKAASETGGIGTSFVMHSMIVAAIELRLMTA